jgi:uncharacterized membrane protein
VGENEFAEVPMALYILDLLMCGAAYYLLERALIAQHGTNSDFARALGTSWKDKASVVIYLVALGLAFVNNWLALAGVVLVALMWIVPDRRFARPVETRPT